MPGIVVDPSTQPDPNDLYAATGGEFVPPPTATYFVLTRNGVHQLNGLKYEAWDYANADAQALNNGADEVDNNAWGVVAVAPANI